MQMSHGLPTGGAQSSQTAAVSDKAEEQVRLYLAQPNVPLSESPTVWWRDNSRLYPQVSRVARRFLSAPAMSVPSEQLFSAAGHVYSDRRKRLLPKRAEMLLFVRENIEFA